MYQMVLPIPFISWSDTSLTRSYFTSAYDFSRQFLHKWTVNWRFVSEDTFLSKEFKNTLLALHVSIVSPSKHTPVVLTRTRWVYW
jgi:alpha-1,3-mannosyltransferase